MQLCLQMFIQAPQPGLMFHPLEYSVKEDTGYVDYDMMEEVALRERPNLIIGGASPYSRFRQGPRAGLLPELRPRCAHSYPE